MTTVSGTVYDSSGTPVSGRTVRAYRRDTGVLLGTATTGDGSTIPGDSNYGTVVLHLALDGADASTTITDASGLHTVTAYGNAQIDTAQSKFGGASLLLDGTGDYVDTPDSADWAFGSGDFTIRFWIRFNSVTGAQRIIGQADAASANVGWQVQKNSSHVFVASGAGLTTLTGSTTCTTGVWYHVAFVGNSGTIRLYVDGVQEASAAYTTVADSAYKLGIGRFGEYATDYVNGWIDDLQINKGYCYYPSGTTYTVPSAALYTSLPINTVLGEFSIDLSGYSGEINVIELAYGSTQNDLILRTTGV